MKHAFTVMLPSIPVHTLVTLVHEKSYERKNRFLVLPLEANQLTSKLAIQNLPSETYQFNPEIMLTQTNDPNSKRKPQLRKNSKLCQNSNHSTSNRFGKQRKRNFSSRSKWAVKNSINN